MCIRDSLLGTAAFCGFRIYHYYAEVDEQTEAFEMCIRDRLCGYPDAP